MLTVYGVPVSPFVRKVLLALEHKGVAYELTPVFPGSADEPFASISPLKKVPAITHDDFSISDSSIICRYIDQAFDGPALYPSNPAAQARACWLEELGDSRLIEATAGIFQERWLKPNIMKQEGDESRAQDMIDNRLPPLLTYLETQVPESGMLAGDDMSIADIGIVTAFIQAQYGNYQPSADAYPRLAAYLARAMQTELFQNRHKAEQEAVQAMAG
jgi:glutathione S-transferase